MFSVPGHNLKVPETWVDGRKVFAA